MQDNHSRSRARRAARPALPGAAAAGQAGARDRGRGLRRGGRPAPLLAHLRPVGRRAPLGARTSACSGSRRASRTASWCSPSRREFLYKTTDYYAPEHERTLLWNDPGARHRLAARGRAAPEAQGRRAARRSRRPRPSREERAGHRRRAARSAPSSRASSRGRAEVVAHDRATLDLADPDAIARARARRAARRDRQRRRLHRGGPRRDRARRRARGQRRRRPASSARKRSAAARCWSTSPPTTSSTARRRAPYVETDAAEPARASTARTKLEGERAIAAAGCDHLILRTSWVYGPRGKNFLLTMLRARARRARSCAWSTTSAARPPRAAQLARLVRELLDRGGDIDEIARARSTRLRAASGIYHATAAGETTWFGFAQAIFESWRASAAPAFTRAAARRRSPRASTRRPRGARPTRCSRTRKLAAAFGVAHRRLARRPRGSALSAAAPEPRVERAEAHVARRGWRRARAR